MATTDASTLFDWLERYGYSRPAELLHTFSIPRIGWEMDNDGWVFRWPDGSIEAFTTSHGGLPVSWESSADEDIRRTEESLVGMRRAVQLSRAD